MNWVNEVSLNHVVVVVRSWLATGRCKGYLASPTRIINQKRSIIHGFYYILSSIALMLFMQVKIELQMPV